MGASRALNPLDAESDLPRSIRRGPKITRRIALEEYAELRRTQLRYRRIRRYRQQLAQIPTWKIEPE